MAESSNKKPKLMDTASSAIDLLEPNPASPRRSQTVKELTKQLGPPRIPDVVSQHNTAKFGYLKSLRLIRNPVPISKCHIFTVNTQTYVPFFTGLYQYITYHLYQGIAPPDIISEVNFCSICRIIMRSRIDQIYESITLRRPPNPILIPRPLADIINSIGTITLDYGGFTIIPKSLTFFDYDHLFVLGFIH